MPPSADERRLVEFGALLHDVGKIAVPKEIVNRPGPLDDEEWAVMKEHTVVGQQMLDRVGGSMTDAGEIVRASHEHWDGNGYPAGIAGEDVPLAARVVGVADAFSAITTTRAYRRAQTPQAAMEELRRCAGRQFDPEVVEALMAVLTRPATQAPSDSARARPEPPALRAVPDLDSIERTIEEQLAQRL